MNDLIFSQHKIIILKKISSTNEYASKLLKTTDIDEGTIIMAISQTKGKGQYGNIWESHKEMNLTFSIILKPSSLEPVNQFLLNKVISLSIIDYLNQLIPQQNISIKWPNDIYINKSKIAGILIENQIMGNQIKYSIIGIGLNINQTEFSKDIPNPVSLKEITQKNYSIKSILYEMLSYFENRLSKLYINDLKDINSDYLNNLLNYNLEMKYIYKNEMILAKIIDINKYGKLILEYNQSIIECDLKEIKFILD